MKVAHTYNCLLPGYESLEITINVRLTDRALAIMREQGRPATAIVDFPNWDDVAQVCQLFEIDPLTGESTETPLAKPDYPLTWAGLATLPFDLQNYITGQMYLRDGIDSYTETVHPKLRGS